MIKAHQASNLLLQKSVVQRGRVSVVGRKSINVMSRFRVGNVPVCSFYVRCEVG
jgi:hypothetical protein